VSAPVGPPLVALCFFGSGAASLVYEVVWLRWLIHVFGATTLAVSVLLGAFMTGLAVGSWGAGWLGGRLRQPLAAYGLLEALIGLYALALPTLLAAVVPAVRALGLTETSSPTLVSATWAVFALALFVAPTAGMGATLPLLAGVLGGARATRAGRVGGLYAINTLGAVVGAALAGFFLLPVYGGRVTNLIAAVTNGAVAAAALALARGKVTGPAPLGPGETSLPAPARADDTPERGRVLRRGALAAAGVSGALALVYEVGWTRALSLVLGSSVYAFTVMLVTFLAGLAGGGALAARRADRVRDPGLALGLLPVGVAASAFAGLVVLGELPYAFVRLFGLTGGRYEVLLPLEFLLAGALILGPALGSGAVFPMAVRLVSGSPSLPVERGVGHVYAVNTVGAIVGSFVAGFVLLPFVGIRGTLVLGILLDLAFAFALLLVLPSVRRWWSLVVVAAIPVAALAATAAAPAWDPLVMASGVVISAPRLQFLPRAAFRQTLDRPHLLFYEEGLTTTVSVEAQPQRLALRVNGKMDASTGADMPNQVLVAHLPLLFHPDPQDVAVVGLGSGVTVGSVLRHPVRTVTVVELEEAVVRASHFFDAVSFQPLADPRTRLVINDARSVLTLTPDRFDVIISEPSNPWLSGAASLFTRDFFELARARLRSGGVFGQWLQLYQLTPAVLRSVVATFHASFPNAVVFRTSIGDTVLVGSEAPLRLSRTVGARLGQPSVRADLRRVGIERVDQLLAQLVLDVEDVARVAAEGRLNTDDNGYVEFEAPRSLYRDALVDNARLLTSMATPRGRVRAQLTAMGDGPPPPGAPRD